MEIERCPTCRKMRLHENGTCLVCGYCSSIRASINALYTPKKTPAKYEKIKMLKRLRKTD